MGRMTTRFTTEELKAIGTATVLYPRGFTINAERIAERETCDALVESGHFTAIAGVDGGYRLSDGLAAEVRQVAAEHADRVREN